MTEGLEAALRTVISEMVAARGVGTHVHFDDPVFEGLVPAFEDARWLRLGSWAAGVAADADVAQALVVRVPIGTWSHKPDEVDLMTLKVLDPFEPPSINLLPVGLSGWRRHEPGSEVRIEEASSVRGWISKQEDDGAWLVSVYFEAVRAGA